MKSFPEFFREPHGRLKINNAEPVLVALSGGADSTSLLHLLHKTSKLLGFPLYAAHVNHNIRTTEYGNEAARDEAFCKDLCQALGVTLFCLSADIPAIAAKLKISLETAARNERYSFFANIMTEHGIKILATAHNANDNLETQIFNLARGCGIDGISGIPEVRDFPLVDGGIIVRPILSATKTEILDYCRDNKLNFVTDSTNLLDDCTRNRIRHNIVPELCALFGTPEKAAARLSRLARADAEYLDSVAVEHLDGMGGIIELSKFNELHPAIASRVCSNAYREVTDTQLEQSHIDAVIKLAKAQVAHSSISLPQKIAARIEHGNLIFVKDEESKIRENYEQPLSRGVNVVGNGEFLVLIGEDHPKDELECNGASYSCFASAYIHTNEIDSLIARNRREGDLIRSAGMTKKVKKLLCDKKISLTDRDILPFICRQENIIYIPACAIADEVIPRKTEITTNISIYKKR